MVKIMWEEAWFESYCLYETLVIFVQVFGKPLLTAL